MMGLKSAFEKSKIIAYSSQNTPELYKSSRLVAANIVSMLEKEQAKLVAISGINAHDKAGEISFNVALRISEGYKRVLFVDCDFSGVKLSTDLKIESPKEIDDLKSAITQFEGSKLDIITCESLKQLFKGEFVSLNIAEAFKKLNADYEYIIFSTDALQESLDGAEIAKNLDCMIMVVNKLYTKKHDIDSILESLKYVDIKLVGAVFVSVV